MHRGRESYRKGLYVLNNNECIVAAVGEIFTSWG